MQVKNVLHAARWKYRTQKLHKKSPSAHHHTTLSGYIFATKAHIDNWKKYLLTTNVRQYSMWWPPCRWWRPLFNAAVWLTPTTRVRAVRLPRRETRWNLQGCPKLTKRSQPLGGRTSPYCGDMWRRYCCLTSFYSAPQCSHWKRCISYGNSVRPSVCPSHAGIVSKRRHVAWCS